MIWRHLLLLAVVPLGAVAVVVTLFPKRTPEHWRDADRGVAQVQHDADFQRTLAGLNKLFVERWNDLGIQPAPRADDLTILRRLSLALAGTVPSLEEIRMFQRTKAGQKDLDVAAWWTAGVLADQRSSDYLGERFARAFVGTIDGPFLIYRRRRFVSWLGDELHANRPYDQIVRKLIASDGLWTSAPATNFITVAINAGMENKGPDETKLAARVYRAFLGIRIDCAQCHDHPFASWKQEDFHNLAAFFAHTEQSFTGVREGTSDYVWVKHQRTNKTGKPDREPEPTVPPPVATIEDDATPDASPSEMMEQAKLLKDPNARLGTPGVPFYPELVGKQGNRRERLAAWVTDPKNKSFARATVNRVWALLLGRPMIDPVDDIPFETPSDRSETHYFEMQVLNLLADDFAAHQFDLRRLIQLIAQSQPFQRAMYEDPKWSDEQLEAAIDAWATFKVSRLRPEQVSGAILQASSVQTIDRQSHVLTRLQRAIGENDFVKRYGDEGEDELLFHSGTIPQRLLMLNGDLVKDRTTPNPVLNGATHIAMLAPDEKAALESAYLATLTRLPTADESRELLPRLKTTGVDRQRALEDIFATLFNSWEASWNH